MSPTDYGLERSGNTLHKQLKISWAWCTFHTECFSSISSTEKSESHLDTTFSISSLVKQVTLSGSTKTRNTESGIRKRNHGNGNGNGIWERGIQEIIFKISNNHNNYNNDDDNDDDDDGNDNNNNNNNA